MSEATIRKFYGAFAELDDATMAQCYAEDVRFDDEVFSLQGRREVAGMWRMLCAATRDKGRADWRLEYSQVGPRSAHWDAHYRFSGTGRLVLNRIDASFEFDPQGLIVRHIDRFDFWAWSRQALGLPGLLLGWSPMLRNKVRAQAGAKLQQFLARSPA